MTDKYKIIRFFKSARLPSQTIVKGLSLEQAQRHCKDPETNSKTATDVHSVERTKRLGSWFDGYDFGHSPKRNDRHD